jgi:hypothetical protein
VRGSDEQGRKSERTKGVDLSQRGVQRGRVDASGGLQVDGPGAVRTTGFDVLADLSEEVIVGLWVGLRYAPGNVSMSANITNEHLWLCN